MVTVIFFSIIFMIITLQTIKTENWNSANYQGCSPRQICFLPELPKAYGLCCVRYNRLYIVYNVLVSLPG